MKGQLLCEGGLINVHLQSMSMFASIRWFEWLCVCDVAETWLFIYDQYQCSKQIYCKGILLKRKFSMKLGHASFLIDGKASWRKYPQRTSMTPSSLFSTSNRCRRGCLGASWKRKVKKAVEDWKLESKIAGWGQLCWVGPITVHSLGRRSVHVPTIGSRSGWQHGQSWAALATVPATEGQAYWEAVWRTQWVRQTCCINRLFAAVARNKP